MAGDTMIVYEIVYDETQACSKCGGREMTDRYFERVTTISLCKLGELPDIETPHSHRTCRRCDHRWIVFPQDVQKSQEVSQ